MTAEPEGATAAGEDVKEDGEGIVLDVDILVTMEF